MGGCVRVCSPALTTEDAETAALNGTSARVCARGGGVYCVCVGVCVCVCVCPFRSLHLGRRLRVVPAPFNCSSRSYPPPPPTHTHTACHCRTLHCTSSLSQAPYTQPRGRGGVDAADDVVWRSPCPRIVASLFLEAKASATFCVARDPPHRSSCTTRHCTLRYRAERERLEDKPTLRGTLRITDSTGTQTWTDGKKEAVFAVVDDQNDTANVFSRCPHARTIKLVPPLMQTDPVRFMTTPMSHPAGMGLAVRTVVDGCVSGLR